MRKNNYSQLPVYDDNEIVGSISEKDINNYISIGKDLELLPKKQVGSMMGNPFPQVEENFPVEPITHLLDHSHAVLTTKKGKVVGIITKADSLKLIRK